MLLKIVVLDQSMSDTYLNIFEMLLCTILMITDQKSWRGWFGGNGGWMAAGKGNKLDLKPSVLSNYLIVLLRLLRMWLGL